MKQVEFAAQFAVVALLGFFEHGEVLLQLVLAGPGGAVDALQHLIVAVAAPIGARHFHQLEVLELTGAGHVRPTTQIFKTTLAVQRHVFTAGNAGDDFGLVFFTHAHEMGHSFIARQHAAHHGFVFGGKLTHLFFNGDQIFGREGTFVRKIVIEAVLDHRANRDLGVGVQLFDGVGQQVCGGVANHFQAIGVFGGHDGQRCVFCNLVAGINQTAVDFAAECGLGQTCANGCGHLCHGHRAGKLSLRAVGKRDVDHGYLETKKRGHDRA